jgi:hypothetical protein
LATGDFSHILDSITDRQLHPLLEDSRMRKIVAVTALFCAALVIAAGTDGGEKGKKATLKGKITCNKCDLGKSDACETVIVVKEKDKDVVYFFDKASHKKHHSAICTESKNGTVEGTVADVDKKKVVTVTKLTFDK